MWEDICERSGLDANVEFGMHQLERTQACQSWRRHGSGSRFKNINNALFSDKGAYAACTGRSPYPKNKYSATDRLVVPFAAAWEQQGSVGFLVRAGVPFPEVTLVPTECLEEIQPIEDGGLLSLLSCLFGEGARANGVRWLTRDSIRTPSNRI